MVFIIGSLVIMLIGMHNLKRGFLLYLLFQMIWFPDTQVINISGMSININLIVALYFSVIYFIKRKKSDKEPCFPYYVPMMFISLSLIMTCFTSIAGFFSEFAKSCGLIFMELVIVYLIWKLVDTKEDFSFLIRGITIIVFVACIYMIYESIVKSNFILAYKLSCTSNELHTYADFMQYELRGYRCYSIFEHPICASMIFALYVVVAINLLMDKKQIPFKMLAIITMILCIPCIFMTKQRSGMFFLIIGIFSVVNFKMVKFYKGVILASVVLLMLSPFIAQYMDLFFSMFSSKFRNVVSGSNGSMRLDQLDAVYNIMKISPIGGLGENFRRFYTSIYTERALDFESLWFEQMAKHGILGVSAYLIMIYYSVVLIPLKYKSKKVLFVSLAYWLTYSLTSTPYFRTYFLYAVLFYFIKEAKQYQDDIMTRRYEMSEPNYVVNKVLGINN